MFQLFGNVSAVVLDDEVGCLPALFIAQLPCHAGANLLLGGSVALHDALQT